jgi:outer membrane lipoprotein SlyB
MKFILLILLTISQFAWAYDCANTSGNAGGWIPESCSNNAQVNATESKESFAQVISVRSKEQDNASGVGAAVGAVAGGVVGNSVTGKKNKTLGTVLGAVAGGVAGHYGEKYINKKTIWEVRVKMLDGSERKFEFDKSPDFNVGDEVIVSGENIYKRIQ